MELSTFKQQTVMELKCAFLHVMKADFIVMVSNANSVLNMISILSMVMVLDTV